MPPCKCFMALGRCPMDERRAMEKRLLEGVDELYKLNNLDTELASEHDDRIKHLEERVAALEQLCDHRLEQLERAGGPEPAAPEQAAAPQPRSCTYCHTHEPWMDKEPPGGVLVCAQCDQGDPESEEYVNNLKMRLARLPEQPRSRGGVE